MQGTDSRGCSADKSAHLSLVLLELLLGLALLKRLPTPQASQALLKRLPTPQASQALLKLLLAFVQQLPPATLIMHHNLLLQLGQNTTVSAVNVGEYLGHLRAFPLQCMCEASCLLKTYSQTRYACYIHSLHRTALKRI